MLSPGESQEAGDGNLTFLPACKQPFYFYFYFYLLFLFLQAAVLKTGLLRFLGGSCIQLTPTVPNSCCSLLVAVLLCLVTPGCMVVAIRQSMGRPSKTMLSNSERAFIH